MYSRELLNPPKNIVKNKKPVFGTFEGYPSLLDIRGVRTPFANIHLPHFLTDFRIRSMINLTFEIGPYIGNIDFYDEKIFGYTEVIIWHKETSSRFSYKTYMGPRRRFIPHELTTGFVSSFKKKNYVKINWDHKHDRFTVVLNMKGDSNKPDLRASFIGRFSDQQTKDFLTVIPYPTKRRCSATYFSSQKINGSLSLGKTKLLDAVNIQDTDGTAILKINRSYYNVYNISEYVSASGTVNGKQVSFVLSQNLDEAVEPDTYNENMLIVDGKCTPLPSVTITHPMGITDKWIIQDTENMVDLTFTPESDNYRELSLYVFESRIHTLCGTFEGAIKASETETVEFDEFHGIAKNQMMRL